MDPLITFLASLQPLRLADVPPRLKRGRQHVVWKPELRRDNKIGKAPYSPQGYRASSVKPNTWGTFAEAVGAYQRGNYSGIGYVLTGGIILVDLDHCRDAATGRLTDEAQKIVLALDSYAEASPTGTGVHIYLLGELSLQANRYRSHELRIEVYQRARYTTLTGQHLEGTPADLQPHAAQLSALITSWEQGEEIRGRPRAVRQTDTSTTTHPAWPHMDMHFPAPAFSLQEQPDEVVLAKARAARNGEVFRALESGGNPFGRGSRSEADFDFVLMLLYWTNDNVAQTKRLFRASGRYDAEKTDRVTDRGGHTYLDITVYNALRKRGKISM